MITENIYIWKTKFKVKNEKINDDNFILFYNNAANWVVTEFAKSLKHEFLYVVQPLINEEYQAGVSGLNAIVLTEEELDEYFQLA